MKFISTIFISLILLSSVGFSCFSTIGNETLTDIATTSSVNSEVLINILCGLNEQPNVNILNARVNGLELSRISQQEQIDNLNQTFSELIVFDGLNLTNISSQLNDYRIDVENLETDVILLKNRLFKVEVMDESAIRDLMANVSDTLVDEAYSGKMIEIDNRTIILSEKAANDFLKQFETEMNDRMENMETDFVDKRDLGEFQTNMTSYTIAHVNQEISKDDTLIRTILGVCVIIVIAIGLYTYKKQNLKNPNIRMTTRRPKSMDDHVLNNAEKEKRLELRELVKYTMKHSVDNKAFKMQIINELNSGDIVDQDDIDNRFIELNELNDLKKGASKQKHKIKRKRR